MEIVQPVDGQTFDIGELIQFAGTAPSGTQTVTLMADQRFPLGEATISGPLPTGEVSWVLNRRLLGAGDRRIDATSLDAEDNTLDSVHLTITVKTPTIGDYTPPIASLGVLNDIVRQLEDNRTERLTRAFTGERVIFKFPQQGDVIYIDSKLDLDTDGSAHSEGPDHQDDTSLHHNDGTTPIDANAIPYYVLPNPGTPDHAPGGAFFKGLGITWGDIAAIIFHDRVCFAIFADGGPQKKLGEASIEVHRELGFERLRPDGSVINAGIDAGVVTIIFPRSGQEFTDVAARRLTRPIDEVMARVEEKGRQLFTDLGGQLPG